MKKFNEFNINFVGNIKKYVIASLAIILAGVIAFAIMGVELDINFKGGSRFTYTYEGEIDLEKVEKVADKTLLWTDEQTAREVYVKAYECALAGFVTEELVCDFGISVTTQSQGAEGVLAGVTAYGGWLPMGIVELYQYENDPVIVTAMRQVCHRYLYALANSAAMNRMGENTTVKLCQPWFVLTCWIATGVFAAAFVFFAVLWHRGKKAWRKTNAYLNYRTLKNTLKEEKKS